jgi:outer membrane immunogenic protein
MHLIVAACLSDARGATAHSRAARNRFATLLELRGNIGARIARQRAEQPGARCLFIAMVAFVAIAAGSVHAADRPASPKSPACITNWWQGWYLGINGSAAGYTAYRTDQDAQLIPGSTATYTQKQSGIFGGGGQLGYNWTTCHGLLGIEVDGDDGSIVASTGVLPNSPLSNASITSRLNALVTARVRAGIVADNTWLMYASGGVASVHTLTTYLNLASEQFSFSDWRWGWAAGLGAELRISDNISLRSEMLYVGIADRTYTFVSPARGTGNFAHSDSIWLARVGINVKLGFDPAIPTY